MPIPDAIDLAGLVEAFLFLVGVVLAYHVGYERGHRDTVGRFERYVELKERYRMFRDRHARKEPRADD